MLPEFFTLHFSFPRFYAILTTEVISMAEDKKKRAAAAAVAAVTAGSVVVGGLFTDPDDLLSNDAPAPITATLDSTGDGGDDGDSGAATDQEEQQAAESGLRDKLRARILALPLWVRLVFILPFWALGFGVTSVATALWAAVLSPLMSSALGWVVMIAAMVGAFALAAKAIFPDMPWRKIVNRRTVPVIIVLGVLLGAADLILPAFWTGYIKIRAIVRLVGTLGIVGGVTTAFAVRRHKKRMAEIAASEPDEETAEEILKPLTHEDILAMADSVSWRR